LKRVQGEKKILSVKSYTESSLKRSNVSDREDVVLIITIILIYILFIMDRNDKDALLIFPFVILYYGYTI